MRWMILATLALSGSVAAQTIYQCEVDGQLVFSQQPCGEDAKEIEHDFPVVELADPAETRPGNFMDDDNYVKRVRIERRISRHEATIRNLQRQRDREIAAIRRKARYASNNLAGATWEQSLATEMQALTDRYNSEIGVEQSSIDRLRDDLDRLRVRD